MLRSFLGLAASKAQKLTFLTAENVVQQQLRTTFILKRRFAPIMAKKGQPPRKFRARHYIYDLVKDTNRDLQPTLNLILTNYVEGLGNAGEKVSVSARRGYEELLLPGLAVYSTPENTEKYQNFDSKDVKHYSSANAAKTMEVLSSRLVSITMNKECKWTLQPWHIRASFRKIGYVVPEEAIEIPKQPITGPNLDLQGKAFYVTVTINNTEKIRVKCRIHHWSTKIADRLPYQDQFWKIDAGFIFPEEAEV